MKHWLVWIHLIIYQNTFLHTYQPYIHTNHTYIHSLSFLSVWSADTWKFYLSKVTRYLYFVTFYLCPSVSVTIKSLNAEPSSWPDEQSGTSYVSLCNKWMFSPLRRRCTPQHRSSCWSLWLPWTSWFCRHRDPEYRRRWCQTQWRGRRTTQQSPAVADLIGSVGK